MAEEMQLSTSPGMLCAPVLCNFGSPPLDFLHLFDSCIVLGDSKLGTALVSDVVSECSVEGITTFLD